MLQRSLLHSIRKRYISLKFWRIISERDISSYLPDKWFSRGHPLHHSGVYLCANGRIVGVVPSYFMFQVYSEMYGRNFVKVPYKEDLSMDVNDIIR